MERGCQGSWDKKCKSSRGTGQFWGLLQALSVLYDRGLSRSPVGTLNAVRAVYHLSCSVAVWNDQEMDASLARVVPMRVSKSSTDSLSLV